MNPSSEGNKKQTKQQEKEIKTLQSSKNLKKTSKGLPIT